MRVPGVIAGPAFSAIGFLPRPLRNWLIGLSSPAYRVGTAGYLPGADGRILLARHSYRKGWGLLGGILGWREEPIDSIVREMAEEVGIDVEVTGPPALAVIRSPRRVVLIYPLAFTADGNSEPVPTSPEIAEIGWFDPDDLPVLDVQTPRLLAVLADQVAEYPPNR